MNRDTINKKLENFLDEQNLELISKIRKIKISLLRKIDSIKQQIKIGYLPKIIIA